MRIRTVGRKLTRIALAALTLMVLQGAISIGQTNAASTEVPAVLVADSESERFEYDPATCSSNAEDMIYVAIGRDVFRFPASRLTFIGTKPREPRLPTAPNSSDPEGCPSNPLRASSFSFSITYPEEQFPADHDPMLEELAITAVGRGLPGLQESNETVAEKWCSRKDVDHRIIDGVLEECRFRDTQKTFPEAESSRAFRSLPNTYSVPFGRPYVVICHHGILTLCEVNYRLSQAIKVRYEFFLKRIKATDLVKFDQSLRGQVEDARVINYPWSTE